MWGVNVAFSVTTPNKRKKKNVSVALPLLCMPIKCQQCKNVSLATASERNGQNHILTSWTQCSERESGHVLMALRKRKRHFPSGVSTQRGQFSKSSPLFRFTDPAVHSQVREAFCVLHGSVFFHIINQVKQRYLWQDLSSKVNMRPADEALCVRTVGFNVVK